MTSLGVNIPALLVLGISIVVGWLMTLLFRYTSDQKAIQAAKDHLKAHLLALRLYQDQIYVVLRTYARIVLETGRYIRLAFLPLLLVIAPLTFLIVQLDRYLGLVPIQPRHAFLVKARVADANLLNDSSLQLPTGLTTTSPAVRVPAENGIAWRVVASRDGDYVIDVKSSGQMFSKSLVVGSGLHRLSPVRLRGRFWQRLFLSGEPALPENDFVESISVHYPSREIAFAGLEWNWIWLFFVLSMIAGFIFKSILGVQI